MWSEEGAQVKNTTHGGTVKYRSSPETRSLFRNFGIYSAAELSRGGQTCPFLSPSLSLSLALSPRLARAYTSLHTFTHRVPRHNADGAMTGVSKNWFCATSLPCN